MKHSVKNFVLLAAGILIYSFGTQFFIVPAEIAPGGAIGIALMLNHVFRLPVGALVLVINLPLLVLSWFWLSRRFTVHTALATVLVSVVLDYVIAPVCPLYQGDRLMASAYGGIVVGIGMALIFLAGYTTGGTDIAGYLLQKKLPQFSIGRALMTIEGVILFLSIFVFQDINAGLFGLLSVYVQTRAIDMVLYGKDTNTQAAIVTAEPELISKRIIAELDRTATILRGTGAYSGRETSVLLCVVRKSEYSRLKRIISECDRTAFVMVSESSEVLGLGFKDLEMSEAA